MEFFKRTKIRECTILLDKTRTDCVVKMAANTKSDETINKLKNNPAPVTLEKDLSSELISKNKANPASVILEPKELSSELRNKIQSNPASVILRQKEQSEATAGILGAHLRGLRMSRGVLNKFDEKEQNAQIVRELKQLSEHNFLLYLVLTKQYERIREIFFDQDLFARELALIKEIEREEARASAHIQQQTPFFDPLKPQTTTTNTTTAAASVAPHDYSHFFVQGVSNMDLYRYYVQEYRRVTHEHYTAQTEVIEQAHHGRAQRMMKLHDSLDLTSEHHVSIRAEIKETHDTYLAEHGAIMARSIVHPDGTSNEHALKQRYEDLLALDHKYEKKYADFLIKHKNEPGFAEAYKEELDETRRYKEALEHNDQKYEEVLSHISPHLERTGQAVKANIEENLNAIIGRVARAPTQLLDKEQQEELNGAVSRLNALKEQVKDADSPEQKDELLTKCSKELETIKRIAYPLMTGQLKQQFEKDVDVFQRFANKEPEMAGLNAKLNGAPGEMAEQAPSFAKMQEDEPGAEIPQEADQNAAEPVAPEPGLAEVEEYEPGAEIPSESVHSIAEAEMDEYEPGAEKVQSAKYDAVSHEVNQSSIEAQRRLKMSLHMSRHVLNGSDIALDEGMKIIASSLINIAKELKGVAPSDDEDKKTLAEVAAQIDEIKQYKQLEDLPDELVESLASNLEKLADNHDELADIQDKFSVVSELMKNRDECSVRQSAHI